MSVERRYQRTMAFAAIVLFICALALLTATTLALGTLAQPQQASIKWLAITCVVVTAGLLLLKLMYLYIASAALAKIYNECARFSFKQALRVYGQKAIWGLAFMFAVSLFLHFCFGSSKVALVLIWFVLAPIGALSGRRADVRGLEKSMKRELRPELLAYLNNSKHAAMVKGILSFRSENNSDYPCALSFRAAGSATAMMFMGQAPDTEEVPRIFIALNEELLNNLTEEEMRALCLHEIGHWYNGHARKAALGSIVFAWILLAVSLAGAYLLGGRLIDSVEFLPLAVAGVLCGWTANSLVSKFLSRRHEYQADAYAIENGSAEHLVGALEKCVAGSGHSDDCPYWLHNALFGTHPSIPARIARACRLA